jgi:hypothetical protein
MRRVIKTSEAAGNSSTVTNSVQSLGTNYQVTLSRTNANRFFRLRAN